MTDIPTFLILDDDEDTRYLTRRALLQGFLGCRVLECDNVDAALIAARDIRIDGVITDHHLGTKDGCAFIAELRAANISCPVVMVTGTSDPNVHRRASEAGAARVFGGESRDFVSYFREWFSKDGASEQSPR